MRFSQKVFDQPNNESAMKQLFRQYSSTFKKMSQKGQALKPMTQSSKTPNIQYNAFRHSQKQGALKGLKQSQAKSIIQKLLQTKQIPKHLNELSQQKHNQFQDLNQNDVYKLVQGFNKKLTGQKFRRNDLKQTELKIFQQIITLIIDVQQVNQIFQNQVQQINHLKLQLKEKTGIQFVDDQAQSSNMPIIFNYSKKDIQVIFQNNQQLERRIEQLTRQITNRKANSQTNFDQVVAINKRLSKDLAHVKGQILNTGQIDEQQLLLMKQKIKCLQSQLSSLRNQRLTHLTLKDPQIPLLKSQVELLRKKTHTVLSQKPYRLSLIQTLNKQSQARQLYQQQIMQLKNKYQRLVQGKENLYKYQMESKVIEWGHDDNRDKLRAYQQHLNRIKNRQF